ncbi:MAG: hypothetical protein AcusKO_06890 [Acuticoccus sp.]
MSIRPLAGDHVDLREDRLFGSLAERVAEEGRGRRRKRAVTTDMSARLKALERENRELRQANEILRKASAYFAQAEQGRRSKT